MVIPAFEAAGTIAEALESVLAQTVPPLEIIVSDDGSTDGIDDRPRGRTASRSCSLRGPHRGVSAARNAALAVARGDFVADLDADDVYLPERLEALGDLAMAHPDLDILATDAWFEVDGRRQGRFNRLNGFPVDDQRASILSTCFVVSPARASGAPPRGRRLRRVAGLCGGLGLLDPPGARRRSRIGLVDEALYVYRLGEGSLTADHPVSLRSRVAVLDKVAARRDLEASEAELVRALRDQRHREALLAEAEAALLGRQPDARRRALRVATGPAFGAATRLKAIVAALVPALARRALERRRRRSRRERCGLSRELADAVVRRAAAARPADGTRTTSRSFSVVIAAYQVADLVGAAIESALSQTVEPLEVIVCDDGSTDGTGEAVAAARRPDHVPAAGERRRGRCQERRRARCHGRVRRDPRRRRRLPAAAPRGARGAGHAARPDLDILVSDAYLEVDGQLVRRCYGSSWPFVSGDQRLGIVQRNFILGHAAVRRETLLAVGGFDETPALRQRTGTCGARLILSGSRAGLVDEPARPLPSAAGKPELAACWACEPARSPCSRRSCGGTI